MPATKGVSEQDILKIFDKADEPFLSAGEIADELGVSSETARYHLNAMDEDGLVGQKKIGARAIGWWAKVGPRLSAEMEAKLEETEGEYERGETTSHEELKRELGLE